MAKAKKKKVVKNKSKAKTKRARVVVRTKLKSKPKVKAKKAKPKAVKAKKPIGSVTHFFSEISVAIVKFSKEVNLNKVVRFRGATTDFAQKISEMQYNHKPITKSKKGKEVGIKVKDRVREGDKVFEEV
jgi:putative protease